MKVLVTGAAGFLGSHVTEEMLRRGYTVVALDDLSGGFVANVPSGAEFVQGSILNYDLVNRLTATHHFHAIFHLAAYAAEGLSHFIKRYNYTNNLIGSVNLINAAVNTGVRSFIFTSSIAVYGKEQVPMREDMYPFPEDSYGVAKLAVEHELRLMHEMWGINYVVFRPHNVYGERQNLGDRYRNVVGIFMNQIMQDIPMSVYGDGSQTRAFTYVGDIVPSMVDSLHLAESQNQVFNIGADEPVTVETLANAVAKAMDVPPNIVHLPARDEVSHAFSDHGKARRLLGYRPTTPLAEGLERMAAWAKVVGVQHGQVFTAVEVTKRMPEHWLRELRERDDPNGPDHAFDSEGRHHQAKGEHLPDDLQSR